MVERRIILARDIDYFPPYIRDLNFVSVDVCSEIYGCLDRHQFYISRAVADFVVCEFRERKVILDSFEAFRHIRLLSALEGKAVLAERVTHPQMRKTIAENLIEGYTLLGYQ